LLEGLGLPSLRDALLTMHRPPRDADVAALALGTHPAQRRLAIEELLAHHLSLRRQRLALQQHRAPALKGRGTLVKALVKALPFSLTGAQKRVFEQIREDIARPSPMLRLVQGDVGTGMLASMGVHRRPFRCRRAPIGYQSLKERGRGLP